MRIFVMYDLDMSNKERQLEYLKFHKGLISRGFFMMQKSIYIKTINAPTKKIGEIQAIKKKLPKNGNVRVLTVTDRQYMDMEILVGSKNINESINTNTRRIKIKNEEE